MGGVNVKYRTRDDETFDGYLVEPEGAGKVAGILIITAIFGVDDEMRELSNQWAQDGFLVSTPDIFWRQIPGPTHDLNVGLDRMSKFDPVQGLRDIGDLIAHLRAHPRCNGKVAVLGFCFGGRYAHLATTRLGADAGGAFHGSMMGQNMDEADKVTVPVSYHFGDSDPVVPMEEVKTIQQAFADNPLAEIKVYEGATHNFSMPLKQGYDPVVARAAREAVLRCFRSM